MRVSVKLLVACWRLVRAIWQQYSLFVRLVVMVVLLVLVVSRVDLTSLARTIRGAQLFPLVVSFLLIQLGWLINSYKWKCLLENAGLKRSVGELFHLNLAAILYSLILPGQVAGEVLKAMRLGARAERRGIAYASVWLDRVTGLAGLAVVGLLGLAFGPQPAVGTWSGYLYWLLLVVVFILCVVVLGLPNVRGARLFDWVGRTRWGEHVLRHGTRLMETIGIGQSFAKIGVAILLAGLFQAVTVTANWVAGVALGMAVSPLALAWVTAVFALLQILPVSIAGVGVRDVTFVALLSLYKVPADQALALSFVALGHLVSLALTGWLLDLATPSRSSTSSPQLDS